MGLTLEEIKARLTPAQDDLYRRYPIRSLSIFGSFARNEAGPKSDIDILVDSASLSDSKSLIWQSSLKSFSDVR